MEKKTAAILAVACWPLSWLPLLGPTHWTGFVPPAMVPGLDTEWAWGGWGGWGGTLDRGWEEATCTRSRTTTRTCTSGTTATLPAASQRPGDRED